MTTIRKPKCFVAMAFDHDDTDQIYEKSILPVLKANDVKPVIINRREDNRDINNQIIDLLNSCDFCITDLTYTRPSVYFEAGYAQRAVEVIYTVRADHLHKNQPEDLRVQFDLQMKPLIKWQNPKDENFPKRLDRRIKATVLKEWNRAQKDKETEKRQREAFAHMPLNERLIMLRKGALKSLNALGFASWQPLTGRLSDASELTYRQILPHVKRFPWLLSSTTSRRVMKVASLRAEESLSLRPLRDEFGYRFLQSQYLPHLDGMRMVDDPKRARTTIEHHILCSIKAIPQSRIMSAMPSLSWDSVIEAYRTTIEWSYTGSKRDKRKKRSWDWKEVTISVNRQIYVHFVSGIHSEQQFQSEMNKVAGTIQSNQQRN